jgi:hypothetical protein
MKKILGLMFIFALLFLSGCNEGVNSLKTQQLREVQLCINLGGIPLRSAWSSNVMVDCKFPPAYMKN